MLAACGGPSEKPLVTATKDSIPATGDSLTFTEEESAALGNAKSDEYFGRVGLQNLLPTLTAFVPAGFQVMDTCSGDLNLDSLKDWLLVLNRPGEDTLTESQYAVDGQVKRKLLVLVGQPDNQYKLAGDNDNAVYCAQCGGGGMGDPYAALVIKKGYFSIEHYGGGVRRWTRTSTFKYTPADSTWFLHKDGHGAFDAVPEEGRDENKKEKILTVKDFGKISFAEFDIYKD